MVTYDLSYDKYLKQHLGYYTMTIRTFMNLMESATNVKDEMTNLDKLVITLGLTMDKNGYMIGEYNGIKLYAFPTKDNASAYTDKLGDYHNIGESSAKYKERVIRTSNEFDLPLVKYTDIMKDSTDAVYITSYEDAMERDDLLKYELSDTNIEYMQSFLEGELVKLGYIGDMVYDLERKYYSPEHVSKEIGKAVNKYETYYRDYYKVVGVNQTIVYLEDIDTDEDRGTTSDFSYYIDFDKVGDIIISNLQKEYDDMVDDKSEYMVE